MFSKESMVQYLRHIINSAFYEAGSRITFQKFGNSLYRSREMKEAFFYFIKMYNLVIVKTPLLYKMIMRNNTIYILLIFITLCSCQYENAEELYYSDRNIQSSDTTQSDTIVNPELLIDIPFNGAIEDESENKIVIITHGSPELTDNRFFQDNKALYLNGDDQYIEFNIENRDSLSVSFWFNCGSSKGNYSSLFDYGHNAVKTNIDGFSGPTSFNVTTFYNNLDELNAIYNFKYQTWYHIYVSSGNKNTIYVNNKKVGQIYKNVILRLTNSNLVIGKSILDETENEKYFHGVVDDIKVYNYLLSEQEIIELYNADKVVL